MNWYSIPSITDYSKRQIFKSLLWVSSIFNSHIEDNMIYKFSTTFIGCLAFIMFSPRKNCQELLVVSNFFAKFFMIYSTIFVVGWSRLPWYEAGWIPFYMIWWWLKATFAPVFPISSNRLFQLISLELSNLLVAQRNRAAHCAMLLDSLAHRPERFAAPEQHTCAFRTAASALV